MRTLVFGLLCLIASVIVGFAIGYSAMSFRAVATSPVGLNLATRDDPSARVFVEMVRLKEAESVLGSCKSAPTSSSLQASLRIESELIGALRTDAKTSGLAPPLDVAEAILELRSNSALLKSATGTGGGEARTVNELLRRSGWPEDSEHALRDALARMDGACK
jgi:hypothetical protein